MFHFKLRDENGFRNYDDLKAFINITASLSYWDGSNNTGVVSYSRNFKKVRLCNKTDFEIANYAENFEENPDSNFDHCIDNYDGMVVASSIN
jgi:hypothetical protein